MSVFRLQVLELLVLSCVEREAICDCY